MAEIVVIGNEEFTLGFELVGIKATTIDKFEDLLSKNNSAGIVIISQEEYNLLNTRLKNKISKLVKPIVVVLSKDDIKGGDLREQIIRSLGVDLLK